MGVVRRMVGRRSFRENGVLNSGEQHDDYVMMKGMRGETMVRGERMGGSYTSNTL